jgi:hypothetical protein
VDEDDRDAKESEVARDRQGGVAVYLHRSCLQPLPIAKSDGQNMMRSFDFGPGQQIEQPKPLLQDAALTQNSETERLKDQIIQQAANRDLVACWLESKRGMRLLFFYADEIKVGCSFPEEFELNTQNLSSSRASHRISLFFK